MKFSIPFFKKRNADKASDAIDLAHSQSGTENLPGQTERVVPPLETPSEKKPFVVPESAKTMPSFSQPSELADLSEANRMAELKKEQAPEDFLQPQSNQSTAPVEMVAKPTQGIPSLAMNGQDIIAAYKIFLKRFPESNETIRTRIGLPSDRNLFDFLSCDEFIGRKEVAKLIVATAQKMLQVHRQDSESSNGKPNTS